MDLDSALTDKPAEGASATDILRADHREVEQLFSEYARVDGDAHARKVIAQTLCTQIELHDILEREVFYPAVRSWNSERIAAALGEHDEIAAIASELESCLDRDADCSELVLRMKALVERHVREEESTVFPNLEHDAKAGLRELGRALIRRKEELTRSTDEFEAPAT